MGRQTQRDRRSCENFLVALYHVVRGATYDSCKLLDARRLHRAPVQYSIQPRGRRPQRGPTHILGLTAHDLIHSPIHKSCVEYHTPKPNVPEDQQRCSDSSGPLLFRANPCAGIDCWKCCEDGVRFDAESLHWPE